MRLKGLNEMFHHNRFITSQHLMCANRCAIQWPHMYNLLQTSERSKSILIRSVPHGGVPTDPKERSVITKIHKHKHIQTYECLCLQHYGHSWILVQIYIRAKMEVYFKLVFGVRPNQNRNVALGPRFIGLRFGHLMLMQTWHARWIQNMRNMHIYYSIRWHIIRFLNVGWALRAFAWVCMLFYPWNWYYYVPITTAIFESISNSMFVEMHGTSSKQPIRPKKQQYHSGAAWVRVQDAEESWFCPCRILWLQSDTLDLGIC